MKYSVNWLNELAGTNLSPKEMADLFTRKSFEVDELEEGDRLDDLIVAGTVVSVEKHPDADRLKVTRVDAGEKGILTIVCGSPNVSEGQTVAVALDGAVLPDGKKISASTIRGVRSYGMICGADELGLSEFGNDIFVFQEAAERGLPASQFLPKKDAMINLSILSNRGTDALSHRGAAREIAAAKGTALVFDDSDSLFGKEVSREEMAFVEDENLCRRYVIIRISGIRNGESPAWMQNRLRVCGLRPVNAVVDSTNYSMLETGQPLHAFDFQKIQNSDQISVRSARRGEKLTLLNGEEIELDEEDIVIANGSKILALAGIMGGKESGTSSNTTEILLEAAQFNPTLIRKSRMRHKLETESAYRFERGVDPNGTFVGAMRAARLICEITGGKIISVMDKYPHPIVLAKIEFDLGRAEKLLGVSVPKEDAIRILQSIGADVREIDQSSETGSFLGSCLSVTLPSFRPDLQTQEDLIEEIGRIWGYERIEAKAPPIFLQAFPPNERRLFERDCADAFAACGCDQTLSYPFYRKEIAKMFALDERHHFSLQNPINPDQQLFRISMIPCGLEKVRDNLRHFNFVSLFETGKICERGGDGSVREKKMIVAFESGEDSFLELKGKIEAVFSALHIEGGAFYPVKECPDLFHPTRTSSFEYEGKRIAFLGEINPFLLKGMKIKKRVACFEADMDELFSAQKKDIRYAAIPKYPFVRRDMSLTAPKDITVQTIEQTLRKTIGSPLREIALFDVYEKEGVRSVAFRLAFGDEERTLTKDVVDKMFWDGVKALGAFGVKLKGEDEK